MRKKRAPYHFCKTKAERAERKRQAARRYRLAHPEEAAESQRRWHAANPDHALLWRLAHPRLYRARLAQTRAYNKKHRVRSAASVAARLVRLRKAAIVALGGQCVRCGYKRNFLALQIDHIDGDGYRERHITNRRASYYTTLSRLGGQGRYQLLCANCNIIKRTENKELRRRG